MCHVVHASPNNKEKTRCHGPCHVISVSPCNMSSVSRLSFNQKLHCYPIQQITLIRTSHECCVTALARTVHSTIIHTCTVASIFWYLHNVPNHSCNEELLSSLEYAFHRLSRRMPKQNDLTTERATPCDARFSMYAQRD